MDDYVIGIRLALDNGVSEGLAHIRADLASFDTAVAQSASALQALNALQLRGPTPRTSEPAQPASSKAEAPLPILPVAERAVPMSPPTSSSARPAMPAPVPLQPTAPQPLLDTRGASGALAPTPDSATQPAPQIANPVMQRPASFTTSPIRITSTVLPSPTRQLSPNAMAAPQPAPATETTPPPRQTTMSPPTSMTAQRASPLSSDQRPLAAAPTIDTTARHPLQARSPLPAPVAPVVETTSEQRPQPRSSLPLPAAPQIRRDSAGPTTGDIYLDGERLGHWMANKLAEAANAPPAGGTAFDPRLSIAWPTQGGL